MSAVEVASIGREIEVSEKAKRRNRISFKLKRKRVRNPPEMWVRRDAAFNAVVDAPDFAAAQAIILERYKRASDAELLE